MPAARLTPVLIGLGVALATPSATNAQHAPAPAPFAVGTATMLALDSARHGADTAAARPVQITVWYPAQRSSSARVTYGEYFDLSASEHGAAFPLAVRGAARGGTTWAAIVFTRQRM